MKTFKDSKPKDNQRIYVYTNGKIYEGYYRLVLSKVLKNEILNNLNDKRCSAMFTDDAEWMEYTK